ncbi:IclR family transcriptional regulator [Pseudonocardia sp. H11422]|uniref:IclR family transcriptional regulator n=1 Tax=Pseudonocardia sp. H11422 TaxID=2835866 RepID=UPI001BDC0429|nr:IclR family transcriptional regulator [Pseudonocardia sp. H11422]
MPDNWIESRRSVVGRIVAILRTFVTGERHSVTEMARMTGLPLSTTHRLATELVAWGVLERADDGRYRTGFLTRRLGSDPWPPATVYERGPHVLIDLCEATRRRVRLGVLRDGSVAYIEKRVGPDPVSAFSASATLPAHATALGKALLAFAPQTTVAAVAHRLTVYTPHTLDSPEKLHRALATTRLTRLAVSRSELEIGVCAVAAPVFGPGGSVIAAIELQVDDLRTDLELGGIALRVAAGGLSRELSGVAVHERRRALGTVSPARVRPVSTGSH